jgi:hypothetical protein
VLIFHHQWLRTAGKIPTLFTSIIWNEMQDITDYLFWDASWPYCTGNQ